MANKCCFSLLKRFFSSESRSHLATEKRRRRVLRKVKIKGLDSLSAPSPLKERTPSEAEEKQSKEAVGVAIATATAAEVVRLTGTPQSIHQYEEETQEFSLINTQFNASTSTRRKICEREIQAATRIQTAFRGYLARKALRALKGVVMLQAIIRGRAVRRQAMISLKRLQSIVNIQSQVCARRFQMVEGTMHCQDNTEFSDFRGKDIKIDINSQRRWDDSTLSTENANALFSSKREAAIKRERIKEYSFSHRRSTESEQNKVNERWRYWLEKWVDTQLSKREDLQSPHTILPSNARIREEFGGRQPKSKNFQKHSHTEGLDSPIYGPRRSFHHRKQHSIGDDGNKLITGSLVVPTYMAATESAKAKARSMSSPRLRPISLDAFSDTNIVSPYKLSPISSVRSEVRGNCRIGNGNPSGGLSQRSPCLKGLPGPVKSNKTSKDLSFDSECSLPNWDRHGVFR